MVTDIISLVIQLAQFILFVRIVLSWLRLEESHIITVQICEKVDIVLKPIQKVLPENGYGIDLSPIVVFLGLHILKVLLLG